MPSRVFVGLAGVCSLVSDAGEATARTGVLLKVLYTYELRQRCCFGNICIRS